MRKAIGLFFALLLVFSLTGCGVLDAIKDFVRKDPPAAAAAEAPEIYAELDRLLAYPKGVEHTDLSGEFTFTAMILSEAEEMSFDESDDPGPYMYQSACISRNVDDYFLLDVSDLGAPPANNAIVSITGHIKGTIYWTEDNTQVDILDIKATTIETLEKAEAAPQSGATLDVENGDKAGTFEFLGAHRSADVFEKPLLVLYYNYANTGSDTSTPLRSSLVFYHGDTIVNPGSLGMEPKEVDASALSDNSFTNETYAGKTTLYYLTLYPNEHAKAGDLLYVTVYDDDFNVTYDVAIPIFDTLDELTSEEPVDADAT